MSWFTDRQAELAAEFEARRRADEAAARHKLFIKQCMALAASKAVVASMGPRVPAVALLWVEDAVEAAALEMGLQAHVHEEHEVQIRYTGRKRVRRHVVYPTTLGGKLGIMYQGRAVLWVPGRMVGGRWLRRRQLGSRGRSVA